MCRLVFPRIDCFAVLVALGSIIPAAEHPLLPGYSDFPSLTERLQALGTSPHVKLHSLGNTAQGRAIHQLTLGTGQPDQKPAILIVGSVESRALVGSELAVRMAESLAEDPSLLEKVTFYVIPRPNPDGCERAFAQPYRDPAGNGIRSDDDRDGQIAEDPANDLNHDGMITSMRVYRSGGAYRTDPDDPRINVPAKPTEHEPGAFDLYSEGVDDDHDEAWNEDAGDGVEFNRNFSFGYRPYTLQTGPNPVSEIETRAVADFAFDHPNICLVFCFGPQNNLTTAWSPQPGSGPIRSSVDAADAPYFAYLAKRYGEAVKLDAPPPSEPGEGDFLHWAYFHFGRWSLGTPGWSIPGETAEKKPKSPDQEKDTPKEPGGASAEEAPAAAAPPEDPPLAAAPPERRESRREQRSSPRATSRPPGRWPGRFPGRRPERDAASKTPDRSADERQMLRWMKTQDLDGFVPWTEVPNSDFPDCKVEVGGFKPLWRWNPPAGTLDDLAKSHTQYLRELCSLLPIIQVTGTRVEPLGSNLLRLTTRLTNTGYLPTSTQLGAEGGLTYPVQVELTTAHDVSRLSQPKRHRLRRVEGEGATVEHRWLIRPRSSGPGTATIRAASVMTGSSQAEIAFDTAAGPPHPATSTVP